MKKHDRIIVITLTIVVVAVVVYGFFIGGSPFFLQAKKLDAKRLSDFSSLHYAIQSYVTAHGSLPAHLSDLPANTAYPNSGFTNDPETAKPYDYFADTATSYRLCTTFGGDSADEIKNGDNGYSTYYYGDNSLSTTHKKGYDCIASTVTPSSNPTMPLQPVAPKPLSCTAGTVDLQAVGLGISAGFSGQLLTVAGSSSSTVCLWWKDTVSNSKKSYELFEGATTDLGSMQKVKSLSGTVTTYSESLPGKGTACYQLAVKAGDGKTYYPTAMCFGQ